MNSNLKIAVLAALEAGKVIMRVYDTAFDVEIEEDKSPLTEADSKANEIINKYLKSTNIPIISEENKQIDFNIRKEWSECCFVSM